MKRTAVTEVVAGVPYMTAEQGHKVYTHIVDNRLTSILELGTYHGVSTCYLAAAVDELSGGSVVTIDRGSAKGLEPNVDQLLAKLGLSQVATAIYAERSFTWELRRLLAMDPRPTFDFAYLDGGHTWDVTGFAFYLVDQLLEPGGWLLFDDLHWTIENSPAVSNEPWAKALSPEERSAEQINDVFNLLVAGSGRYDTRVDGSWGWAQKKVGVTASSS